jgi:hypothetical protein
MEKQRSLELIKPSEKSFGILFASIFLLISIFLFYKNFSFFYVISFFVIAIVFLIFSFFFPKKLEVLNLIWMKLGQLIGNIVSKVVLIIVFATTITPFGIYFRLVGKDLLNQKIEKKKKSYWHDRSNKITPMKKQY